MISISESNCIELNNYEIMYFDRNRQGGGFECYIRDEISCKKKICLKDHPFIWFPQGGDGELKKIS